MASVLLIAAQGVAAEPASGSSTQNEPAPPSAAFLAFLADVIESDDGLVDALDMADAPEESPEATAEPAADDSTAERGSNTGSDAQRRAAESAEGDAS